MKAYEGVELQHHSFLSSALGGGEWLGSYSIRLTPWKYRRQPLNSRVSTPQGQGGRFAVEIHLLALQGLELYNSSVAQPVGQSLY